MVFWTSFSLLSKDAKLKQIECCAQCFDPNFKKQDSCAQCFAQGLAFLEKLPISRTKTVSQSVSTPSLSNSPVAHALLGKFKIFNKSRQFQAKRYLRTVFWCLFKAFGQLRTVFWTSFSLLTKDANFKQIDSCAVFWRQFRATGQLRTVFWTRFSFLTKVTKFKKKTVAQSVLTPILSNRTVAHCVLDKS